MTKQKISPISSSFRDPSGFLFERSGVLYRQVNNSYKSHYDQLISSELYKKLVDNGLLISHKEVSPEISPQKAYKVLQPDPIPFISYPYEWSFSQLKDAAITTLKIQGIALDHGMVLKDASAYNIQFVGSRPILIDTLSFEKYHEGEAWVGYKQFCQHFLAPLLLMKYKDLRLGLTSQLFIDGIPLDYASKLLPISTYIKPLALLHIHMHSRSQKAFESKKVKLGEYRVQKEAIVRMAKSLEQSILKLTLPVQHTVWGNYYDDTNYSHKAFREKKSLVQEMLKSIKPKKVWDIGANTGEFSRLAAQLGAYTVASDIDALAVERNYLQTKAAKETNLLPLIIDLTNHSPSLGWENMERASYLSRGPADVVMALALVHHLAIGNNVPFIKIAEMLSRMGKYAIVEYVPKSDSNAIRLLQSRKDIFDGYTESGFEKSFSLYFSIVTRASIVGSKRVLYLLKKK